MWTNIEVIVDILVKKNEELISACKQLPRTN